MYLYYYYLTYFMLTWLSGEAVCLLADAVECTHLAADDLDYVSVD